MEPPKIPKWKAFLFAARIPFLQVTIASVIMGILIALSHTGTVDPILAILTLLVAILLHLSVNTIHEYYDWKSGTDNINVNALRPFTGGSGMIQIGALTPKEELTFGLLMLIMGSLLGLYILLKVMMIELVIIGAIAIVSIVFYTGPPLRLSHRGLGEFSVFLNFGPLMTLGTYLVLTRRLHVEPILAGMTLGLLVASILIINEFPDIEADAAVGKKHLVVRLGLSRARYLYYLSTTLPYVIVIFSIIMNLMPIYTALTFLAFPLNIKNMRHCHKFYEKPRELLPANIGTIKHHLLFSILMIVSYILYIFI